MNMKQTDHGFTFVEIIVVVAIIGILSAIAIPVYQDYINDSKIAAVHINHKRICDFISYSQFMCSYEKNQSLPGYPYQLQCSDNIYNQVRTYARYSATLFSNPFDSSEKGCSDAGYNPVKKIGLKHGQNGTCVIGWYNPPDTSAVIQCVTQIGYGVTDVTKPIVIVDSVEWNHQL